jgi:membrane-bound lytic murein transglycosylase B
MKHLITLCFSALLIVPVQAQQQIPEQSFEEWVAALRVEAISLGISELTLSALDQLEPVARVLELDNSQPEFVQTFTRYLGLRVTNAQVNRGQALLQQHAALLEEVCSRYGVQPHYLAAFWAIESNFGRNTGGFSVL